MPFRLSTKIQKIPYNEPAFYLKLQGMTSTNAERRLLADGSNCLSPVKTTPIWMRFLRNMFAGFAVLLWAGAALCFIAYGLQYSSSNHPPGDNVCKMFFNSRIRTAIKKRIEMVHVWGCMVQVS